MGHYPQPFLISGKRTAAKISGQGNFLKYFFQAIFCTGQMELIIAQQAAL
jgi:hypothetical protein